MGRIRNLQLSHSSYYKPDAALGKKQKAAKKIKGGPWLQGKTMTEQLREERENLDKRERFIQILAAFRMQCVSIWQAARYLGVTTTHFQQMLSGVASLSIKRIDELIEKINSFNQTQTHGGDNDHQA